MSIWRGQVSLEVFAEWQQKGYTLGIMPLLKNEVLTIEHVIKRNAMSDFDNYGNYISFEGLESKYECQIKLSEIFNHEDFWDFEDYVKEFEGKFYYCYAESGVFVYVIDNPEEMDRFEYLAKCGEKFWKHFKEFRIDTKKHDMKVITSFDFGDDWIKTFYLVAYKND